MIAAQIFRLDSIFSNLCFVTRFLFFLLAPTQTSKNLEKALIVDTPKPNMPRVYPRVIA